MDFIEACKKVVAIDSTPINGTGEVVKFIASLAESFGFKVHVEEEFHRGNPEANIICYPHDQASKVHFMLQSHLDTVDPGSFALWEKNGRNPFHASIYNNRIYGLGSADSKLDFLCKLFAAREFINREPKKSFAVVGTFGEQYNMRGAIDLVRNKRLSVERALVSEPTEFNLIYAGKGLAHIEITIPFSKEEMEMKQNHDMAEVQSTQCKMFKGEKAHSTRPTEGANAIEKIFDYLEQLPEQILVLEVDGGTNYNTVPVNSMLEFDMLSLPGLTLNQKLVHIYKKIQALRKELAEFRDQNFDPPITTLNLGMIRTYTDHVKIMGCVHWLVSVTDVTYMKWMADLRGFCESIGVVFRVRDHKRPFSTQPDSEFAKSCHEAIQTFESNAVLCTQPVTNEANVFHHYGIETLVFGPGEREGNAHTPEESIAIENLHKAIKIYQNIIEKICFT